MEAIGVKAREEGYGVAPGLCSAELCHELKQHVLAETKRALAAKEAHKFGKVREPENRYDLLLDMQGVVKAAVNEIITNIKPALQTAMGCAGARLTELAAITSHGGAESQPVHADTVHGVLRYLQADTAGMLGFLMGDDEEDGEAAQQVLHAVATDTAAMWTALIALQDVTEDMGPTHVWPGTNNVDHHSRCYSHYAGPGGEAGGQTTRRSKLSVEYADELFGINHKKMCLEAGSAVFYDSRTMHCGGRNTSGKSRTVLVLTFVGEGMMPEGSTYDLLPHLRNQYRLSSFPLNADGTSRPKLDIDIAMEDALRQKEKEEAEERANAKPVPPLNEWQASVQCTKCGKWRPADPTSADALTRDQWKCAQGGFSCFTPQLYSVEEIDQFFEED